ncbi:uncharacterized protein [Ambystoma mexicanum]|uniref:uncharacterized protein n=1 Tax=Ambystoma mexicanum TaxID=8296 RepID=UPI0037E844E8
MRKVHLKEFFMDNAFDKSDNFSGLRNPSVFCAPSSAQSAESKVFEKKVLEEVTKLETKGIPHHSNLSIAEQTILKNLEANDKIIIRQADKGGAIVIMNRNDYIQECEKLLSDENHYLKIDRDPSNDLLNIIRDKVHKAVDEQMISKQEGEYLTRENGRVPIFYTLPKIHKSLENPPGRPIVSGVSSLLEPLSKFVDFYLRPFIPIMRSYIKDTTDAINRIEGNTFDPAVNLLMCLDIQALYTNIPQLATLEVVEETLLKRDDGHPVASSFIKWCTEMALTKNFFQFMGQFYKQIEGTAMGSAMAPNVANLYVNMFEETVVYNERNPFQNNIICWLRYIDDVFVIWKGNEEKADQFLQWLNLQNRYLKFTSNISNKEVNYLDISIYHQNGLLLVRPYTKTTDKNALLYFKSHHAQHVKNNLPFGQFLRLKKNSSTNESYENGANNLITKLVHRGYPASLVKKAAKRAFNNNRESLLDQQIQRERKTKENPLVFVNTFSNLSYKIKGIVTRNWNKIMTKEVGKPIVAFKKSTTVRNLIMRNDVSTKKRPLQQTNLWGLPPVVGHFPCGNCSMCTQTRKTVNVDLGLDRMWNINEHTNCNTNNVIYLIVCPCKLIYIGKTNRKCRTRMIEHRSCIRNKVEQAPMVKHFIEMEHSCNNFEWCILKQVK